MYQDDDTYVSDGTSLYGDEEDDFEKELEEFTFPDDDDSNTGVDF